MLNVASIVDGTDYQRSVIEWICRLKNLPVLSVPKPDKTKPIQFHYRDSVFEGFATTLLFIDTKHPAPEMLIGEPETRAHLFMLALAIANPAGSPSGDIDYLLEATKTADPFLLGNIISLADMLVMPMIDDLDCGPYKSTLLRATRAWNESSSSSSPQH